MALTLSNTFLQKTVSTPTISKKFGIGNNPVRLSCRKKDIHPEIYMDSKVYCNGELVLTTAGTSKEYTVDVWSGNHPFYLGKRSELLKEEDQVEKFRKKYAGLPAHLLEIPVLKGELVLPPKKKKPKKK